MINNLKVNGETLTDASSIADALNQYFVNVGPKLADQIHESEVNPVYFLDQPEPSVFRFRRIDVNEVSKLIAGLKTNKATGLDQIPARALKVGASVVSQPLTHILNSSLSLGIFPDKWKLAKVVPIYKSDDRSDRGNYRPISILCRFQDI